MLEGLEVSEVSIKKLFSDFRIDAETYRPFYQLIESKVTSHKYVTLGTICSRFKKGIFDIKAEVYTNEGIPFVRISNLRNMGISTNDLVYIPESENNKNLDTFLQKGDIILSKTAIPAASIVQLDCCNTSQDTVAIKLADDSFQSSFVVVFLNCKYGYLQMQRWFTGNIQMHLNLTDCKNIFVPQLSHLFQKKINNIFWLAFDYKRQSESLYHQAEELLLETIGLKNFKPNEKGTNIKTFKKSFLTTGRLDAEYYQPKYEEYIKLLKKYSGGFDLLEKACDLKDNSFIPEETKEYKYIELSDIGNSGNITGCMLAKGSELPSRARRKVNTNDVIISSIEGSLESCALVTENYDNALCLTGFYVIKSRTINSEILLVLFKSEVMQNILKQNCSGTILTAINKTEFSQIPVPFIDKSSQKQIASLIKKSFSLRDESGKLLEEAKEMVEREIENG